MKHRRLGESLYDAAEIEKTHSLLKNPLTGRRVLGGFFLFGLLNNVTYVVMLSAAKDIVEGGFVSSVLLAADVPALIAQFCAPFFLSKVPYTSKVVTIVTLTLCSYLSVSELQNSALKLCGVMLTSVCFGLGETTFLALCSNLACFSPHTISYYGSGTGAAGLVGAGLYLLLSSFVGPVVALRLLSALPPILLYAYFSLIAPVLKARAVQKHEESAAPSDIELAPRPTSPSPAESEKISEEQSDPENVKPSVELSLSEKFQFLPRLMPFFLPLLTIYICTFSLNHSLLPYVVFPSQDRAAPQLYVLYFFCYQSGVFISRSSLSVVTVSNLWLLTAFQGLNYALFGLHILGSGEGPWALPNAFVASTVVFWAGLLAGATYVNTFLQVSKCMPAEFREFSMGMVSTATTLGPIVAGVVGLRLEATIASLQSARAQVDPA